MSRQSNLRRREFHRQCEYESDAVRRHSKNAWLWIPVHPMSDDSDLLRRLQMKPSDCIRVDCYWDTGIDIIFLETLAAQMSDIRPDPGVYARVRPDDGSVVVHIVIATTQISSADIEDAMIQADQCGLTSPTAVEDLELGEWLDLIGVGRLNS